MSVPASSPKLAVATHEIPANGSLVGLVGSGVGPRGCAVGAGHVGGSCILSKGRPWPVHVLLLVLLLLAVVVIAICQRRVHLIHIFYNATNHKSSNYHNEGQQRGESPELTQLGWQQVSTLNVLMQLQPCFMPAQQGQLRHSGNQNSAAAAVNLPPKHIRA